MIRPGPRCVKPRGAIRRPCGPSIGRRRQSTGGPPAGGRRHRARRGRRRLAAFEPGRRPSWPALSFAAVFAFGRSPCPSAPVLRRLVLGRRLGACVVAAFAGSACRSPGLRVAAGARRYGRGLRGLALGALAAGVLRRRGGTCDHGHPPCAGFAGAGSGPRAAALAGGGSSAGAFGRRLGVCRRGVRRRGRRSSSSRHPARRPAVVGRRALRDARAARPPRTAGSSRRPRR